MKRYLPAIALAGSAIITTSCAHSFGQVQDACSVVRNAVTDPLVSIPFRVVDGRIYVDARVNGKGPFTFAIDTGASGMGRADSSLANTLGLSIKHTGETTDGITTSTVDMTSFESLQIGDLQRRDLEVITRDYSSRMTPGMAIAGIIGRDFFSDGLLVIDYPSKTLFFSKTDSLLAGDKAALPYQRPFRVPVTIGGMTVSGNLDTGANVELVMPKLLFDKVSRSPLEAAENATLTNTNIETQSSVVSGPFIISKVSLSNVNVRVSDRFPELMVGARALQNFRIMIDQRSKQIAICPAK
jgi:predicted aspartyl protease